MSRARNVKPGFFENEVLADLNPLTRLFFIGLWCEADRRGVLEDRPKRLKMRILPYDEIDVEQTLDDLQEAGFIRRYLANGTPCIHVVNFGKHQNPHRDEKASSLPLPDQHSVSTVQAQCLDEGSTEEAPTEHQTSTALTLNTDSLNLIPDSLGGAESAPGSHGDPLPPQDSTEHSDPPQDDGEKSDRPKPAKRPFRIPADFAVEETEIAWAKSDLGLTERQVSHETNKFRDHFKATGKPHVDWVASWRNWMRRASEGQFGPPRASPPNGKPQGAPLIQHDTAHLSGWAKIAAEQQAAEQQRGG